MQVLIFITLLLAAAILQAGEQAAAFADIQVFIIDGSEGKDLSGLAFCNDRLLANSDKVDREIYAIEFGKGNLPDGGSSLSHAALVATSAAALVTAQLLPALPGRDMHYAYPANIAYEKDRIFSGDFLDWEEIQCRGEDIYLLSERKNGIAKISGDKAEWLPIDWFATLHNAGYLNVYNAYAEGLAIIDDDHFLIALERQPRGLADLRRQSDGAWQVAALPLSNDQQLVFREGSMDVAALTLRNGWLFTLERNASAVCRRDLMQFKAQSCFSYRSVEDDPLYRYREHKYGLAEGLAIDEQFIYIVFDNNNDVRMANESDRRGLLLKIKMPAAWQ